MDFYQYLFRSLIYSSQKIHSSNDRNKYEVNNTSLEK